MLFAILVVVGLGVLPTYASEQPTHNIARRNTCGPLVDAHKKCAPNTSAGSPVYWLCNGKEYTWEPTTERCELIHPQSSESPKADGDWHIGCDDPGHCGYYQDHHSRRSVSPKSEAATRPGQAGSKAPDWLDIPDLESIDTRCSPLLNDELVEKFDGMHWVYHYMCPSGTHCVDIIDSGACQAKEKEFVIPGRSYLWAFNCPDARTNPNTCHFSESIHVFGSPKPDELYPIGTTRCKANGRAVQDIKGNKWTDAYLCQADAVCVELAGWAGCQTHQTLAYPLISRKLANRTQAMESGAIQWPALQRDSDAPGDRPPTRCNPDAHGHVQFFSEWYHKWIDFHMCEFEGGCINWDGNARCNDATGFLIPYVVPPGESGRLPNGDSGHPSTPTAQVADDDDTPPLVQQKIATSLDRVQTRCEPQDATGKVVQYLHPTTQQWLRFYNCDGICVAFPEYAACELRPDQFVIPTPPEQNYQKRSSRRDSDKLILSSLGRQVTHNLRAAMFQLFDTRCNPQNFSEVQRHDDTKWIYYFSCTTPGSCVDVEGYGACRFDETDYEHPFARHIPVQQSKTVNPSRIKTRCTKSNTTEVLQWKSPDWVPSGVCIPAYECYEFAGIAEFALCVHPGAQDEKLWLPWPELSGSTGSGRVTRCKDQATLERLRETGWEPFRSCHGIFTCQDAEGGSNAGCAAPSLYDILTQEPPLAAFPDASKESIPNLPGRGEVGGQQNGIASTTFGNKTADCILIHDKWHGIDVLADGPIIIETPESPDLPGVDIDIHDKQAHDENSSSDWEQ